MYAYLLVIETLFIIHYIRNEFKLIYQCDT